jgi:hypothetical protein
MNIKNLERKLTRELEDLNDLIDDKITRGLSYSREAKRHKFLLISLANIRRSKVKSNWLLNSLSFV